MSWHQRKLSIFLLVLIFCGNLPIANAQGPSEGSGIVTAQNNDQTQSPSDAAQQPLQPLPPSKVQLPSTRTGVDPTQSINLSLRDAVTMALEHNLGIQVEKDNIQIAEFNLEASKGVYDPVFGVDLTFLRSTTPSANQFDIGAAGSNTNQRFSADFGASKLFTTGGLLQASFDNSRSTSNSNSAGLSPSFRPTFNVNLRQPLLRNFRNTNNERTVRSLQKQLDISDLTFRQRLIDLIAQVQNAYYNLGFAISNAEIQRQSVELAAVQLRNNEIQVRAGTAAPIDIVSAQAELERRKDAAIAALLPITQAENTLKTLLLEDPTSPVWNSSISPTDQIEVSGSDIDLSSAINTALERRTEIKQLQLRGELNQIDIDYFRNQSKPQVDIIAAFGGQGLAGDPGLNRDGTQAVSGFQGGYPTALSKIFDFRTYQAGVSISFPLHNRAAKANLGRTAAVSRQIDNQKRQMVQTIISDVRNAVQAVESSRQRVDAAEASVAAAQAQLKGEEQKFAAGLSTNFFVLQRQNELSIARGNLLRAKTDYNIARSDLQRVMANNIP